MARVRDQTAVPGVKEKKTGVVGLGKMDRHRRAPIRTKENRPIMNRSSMREGLDAIPGDAPFVLHEDGLGWLYVPKGLKDGPFPTHYEPARVAGLEWSFILTTRIPLSSGLRVRRIASRRLVTHDFLYVLTTYRLTEHHTAGGMSRFLSHLAELQPEMFAEISPELAHELKIKNGDHICIVSFARGD